MINLSKNPGNTSEDPTDDNKHDINDKTPKILREKFEKKKNPLASLKIGVRTVFGTLRGAYGVQILPLSNLEHFILNKKNQLKKTLFFKLKKAPKNSVLFRMGAFFSFKYLQQTLIR